MLKVIVLLSVVVLSYALLYGYEKVDASDRDVVKAANEAAKLLSEKFSGNFLHRLARIIKAEKSDQEGGGANFIMDIIVGQTSCTKEETPYENIDACDFQEGISTYKKCTVVVFRDANGQHRMPGSGCILATKDEVEGI